MTRDHARAAIEAAREGPVRKARSGRGRGRSPSAGRAASAPPRAVLPANLGGWTVGVLVQSNFGGALSVDGVRVGEALGQYYLANELQRASGDGSVIVIIATDAPLSDRNLTRLARRAFLGIGRTGGPMTNGSGDYALAFSTNERVRRTPARRETAATIEELPNESASPLFQAVVEATEEAVLNSLFVSEGMTGHRGRIEALPVDRVLRLRQRGR